MCERKFVSEMLTKALSDLRCYGFEPLMSSLLLPNCSHFVFDCWNRGFDDTNNKFDVD